ncbi:virulence sensor histidine kinase PhoQ [bacterium MnTg02]|nr:virulence sensor histidine kinase PhoQ [bacterium MnTg02]
MMRVNSLAFRLFALSAVCLLFFLLVMGFVLTTMFRDSLVRFLDRELNQHLIVLIPDATGVGENKLQRPADPGGAPYNIPFSGWYWQIKPLGTNEGPLYKSDSLTTQVLRLPSEIGVEPDEQDLRFGYVEGPDDQLLRVVEREIVLSSASTPDGQREEKRYSFAVAGDSYELQENVLKLTTELIVALTVLGIGLVLVTIIQVRFGLRPLHAISEGLAAIRSGQAAFLKGELPREIEPLQRELNALIQSNRDIVERARTHVGNLAHALKTPLSVITNEARNDDSKIAEKVSEQAAIMHDQITHHLDRARIAAHSRVIGGIIEICPVMESLVSALQKIYGDRKIQLRLNCAPNTKFRGERHDLEEMTGNLLDNACKWARAEVELNISPPIASSNGDQKKLTIFVDDDGPGLTAQEQANVIKRGRRLDESKPGSGLGLSIVAELAHLYKGNLELENSPKGGLRAKLTLPCS